MGRKKDSTKAQKLKRVLLAVRAAVRLLASTSTELTLTEKERVKSIYDYSGGITGFLKIRELLTEAGQALTDNEIVELMKKVGYQSGHMVTLRQFQRLMELLKRRHLQHSTTDTADAFVALGGQKDKTGEINAAQLRQTVKAFGLTLDIDRMIAEVDTDGSGLIDYEEFKIIFDNENSRKSSGGESLDGEQADALVGGWWKVGYQVHSSPDRGAAEAHNNKVATTGKGIPWMFGDKAEPGQKSHGRASPGDPNNVGISSIHTIPTSEDVVSECTLSEHSYSMMGSQHLKRSPGHVAVVVDPQVAPTRKALGSTLTVTVPADEPGQGAQQQQQDNVNSNNNSRKTVNWTAAPSRTQPNGSAATQPKRSTSLQSADSLTRKSSTEDEEYRLSNGKLPRILFTGSGKTIAKVSVGLGPLQPPSTIAAQFSSMCPTADSMKQAVHVISTDHITEAVPSSKNSNKSWQGKCNHYSAAEKLARWTL